MKTAGFAIKTNVRPRGFPPVSETLLFRGYYIRVNFPWTSL